MHLCTIFSYYSCVVWSFHPNIWLTNQTPTYTLLLGLAKHQLLVTNFNSKFPYFCMLPRYFTLFSCSVLSDSENPWTAAPQASLFFTILQRLFKLMCIESLMPSNHYILCHPLLLLPSIIPSIKVFSNESVLHIRWPKYWSFSFSISPSNEYSGLISFRMDWLDLLAYI